jgi:ABC-type nickel/cobalt efflux system permease component RcnA
VTAFGRDIANVTLMQAFVAGVVVALVFLLGLWMIMSAARRGREHRARFREARREAKVAANERDELADRIRQDEEVRSEQETVAMPAANHAGEPVEGRHVQPTDRHQQPVITNVNEGQTPAK